MGANVWSEDLASYKNGGRVIGENGYETAMVDKLDTFAEGCHSRPTLP